MACAARVASGAAVVAKASGVGVHRQYWRDPTLFFLRFSSGENASSNLEDEHASSINASSINATPFNLEGLFAAVSLCAIRCVRFTGGYRTIVA